MLAFHFTFRLNIQPNRYFSLGVVFKTLKFHAQFGNRAVLTDKIWDVQRKASGKNFFLLCFLVSCRGSKYNWNFLSCDNSYKNMNTEYFYRFGYFTCKYVLTIVKSLSCYRKSSRKWKKKNGRNSRKCWKFHVSNKCWVVFLLLMIHMKIFSKFVDIVVFVIVVVYNHCLYNDQWFRVCFWKSKNVEKKKNNNNKMRIFIFFYNTSNHESFQLQCRTPS